MQLLQNSKSLRRGPRRDWNPSSVPQLPPQQSGCGTLSVTQRYGKTYDVIVWGARSRVSPHRPAAHSHVRGGALRSSDVRQTWGGGGRTDHRPVPSGGVTPGSHLSKINERKAHGSRGLVPECLFGLFPRPAEPMPCGGVFGFGFSIFPCSKSAATCSTPFQLPTCIAMVIP